LKLAVISLIARWAMPDRQLLHLVFGGELKSLDSLEFLDPAKLHLVGIYPNYQEAYKAWRGMTGATVDNAHMRYFVVHLHHLLDPDKLAKPQPEGDHGHDHG